MNLVSGAEVARRAGISRAAVSMAHKDHRLPADVSGRYDLDDDAVKRFIARRNETQRTGARTRVRKNQARAGRQAQADESATPTAYPARSIAPSGWQDNADDVDEEGLSTFERRLLPRVLLRVSPKDADKIDDQDPLVVDFAHQVVAMRQGRPRVESIPRLAALKLASDLHRILKDIPPEIDGPALQHAIDLAFARWAADILHEDFEDIRSDPVFGLASA